MKTHHYIEDKTPVKRHYELHDGLLKISGKHGFGRFTTEIRISDVAPHFERVIWIHHLALRRATIYLAIVAGASSICAQLLSVPAIFLVCIAALVALPALIVLFRFSRSFEVERFKSHAGVILFDIIREKKQAAEFDAYIQVLRTAVLEAQPQKPNKAPATSGIVTPPAEPGSAPIPPVAHL
jgi:hypothetical protein